MRDAKFKHTGLSIKLLMLACVLSIMAYLACEAFKSLLATKSHSSFVVAANQEERLLATSSIYAIYLEGFSPCDDCFGQVKMVLKVEDKSKNLSNTLEVREGFRQVSPSSLKASIIDGRALIVGERTHEDQIVVFRLEPSFPIEASVICFRPSISGDGAKVIYASHMARFDERTHTTVLSVLDMRDDSLVPHVIYPPENAARRDPKPFVSDQSLRRVLVSPITWNEKNSKIIFFERLGDKNEIHLVEVGLNESSDAAISYKTKLDVAGLARRDTFDNLPYLAFLVENIRWINEQKIEIFLQTKDFWKTQKFTMLIPSQVKARRSKSVK